MRNFDSVTPESVKLPFSCAYLSQAGTYLYLFHWFQFSERLHWLIMTSSLSAENQTCAINVEYSSQLPYFYIFSHGQNEPCTAYTVQTHLWAWPYRSVCNTFNSSKPIACNGIVTKTSSNSAIYNPLSELQPHLFSLELKPSSFWTHKALVHRQNPLIFLMKP